MNRSGIGVRALNAELQQRLNGQAEPKVTKFGSTFAPGDKVLQTVNNYDKDYLSLGAAAGFSLYQHLARSGSASIVGAGTGPIRRRIHPY